MKPVYFSSYIDKENIEINPSIFDLSEEIHHRYSITIPFHNRIDGGHAVVISKNASNAGKKDLQENRFSDDSIYKITDYLYKLEVLKRLRL